MNLKNTLAMTGAELQELLNKHCEEIRHELSGFLFYGILSCADGTTLAKASGNDDVHYQSDKASGVQHQDFGDIGIRLCAYRNQQNHLHDDGLWTRKILLHHCFRQRKSQLRYRTCTDYQN